MIILGTACIGKTYLGENYPEAIDIESSDYMWIYDDDSEIQNKEARKGITTGRKKNPKFPQNYIDAVLEANKKYKYVVAGLFPELIDYLIKNDIFWVGVYVREELACELYERSLARGNNENFASKIIVNLSKHNERAMLAPEHLTLSKDFPTLAKASALLELKARRQSMLRIVDKELLEKFGSYDGIPLGPM